MIDILAQITPDYNSLVPGNFDFWQAAHTSRQAAHISRQTAEILGSRPAGCREIPAATRTKPGLNPD